MGYDIDLGEVIKIVVPLLGGGLAGWIANRRERQQWTQKREAEQDRVISTQTDQMSAGWSKMTSELSGQLTEMRKLVNQLQAEAVRARTKQTLAEERAEKSEERAERSESRAEKLERDLIEIKTRYESALSEIEELRKKVQRAPFSKTRKADHK